MNVLLYYCYSKIDNTKIFLEEHKQFCNNYNFKGRIIIAEEGINGTISGSNEDCQEYIKFVKTYDKFSNTDFKIDSCHEHLFPKLTIKVKPYLIKLNGGDLNPDTESGIHLSPQDFYNMMQEKDTIVLDVRSNYEHYIGNFKNSITLDIDKFYHFPEKIKNHELYKNKENHDKKILTCCTGGIKCETASAYLRKLGFKNVYQLKGGIIKYGLENGKDFDGKCYVFDGRITKEINKINPKNITKCLICNINCDVMVNCMNSLCDKHFTMCKECFVIKNGCCSEKCNNSDSKRKKFPNYYLQEEFNKN
tara:strand:+ start:1276 stop:2193 length:918 start_codon:yes stop_codon:yes gene_type:complete